MKLVREHIFEKFTEDSDPIHDMGIGAFRVGDVVQRYGISSTHITGLQFQMIFNDDLEPDSKGVILKREMVGTNLKLWIAFFRQDNIMYDKILPNVHRGIEYFKDFSICIGEASYDTWHKHLKKIRKN